MTFLAALAAYLILAILLVYKMLGGPGRRSGRAPGGQRSPQAAKPASGGAGSFLENTPRGHTLPATLMWNTEPRSIERQSPHPDYAGEVIERPLTLSLECFIDHL